MRQFLIISFVIIILSWKWTYQVHEDFKGIFLTRGNKCLALYRDRWGNALTYWSNITKQKLPYAIAFPYNGEYYFQDSK